MKKIAIIFAVLLTAIACQKTETQDVKLKLGYDDISGSWMLESYDNGNELAEGAFQYLNIVRKTRTFQEYVKLESQYPVRKLGDVRLSQTEEEDNVIRGLYTNELKKEWNHAYIITECSREKMVWVAQDDPTVVLVYVKTVIPEYLIASFPELEE